MWTRRPLVAAKALAEMPRDTAYHLWMSPTGSNRRSERWKAGPVRFQQSTGKERHRHQLMARWLAFPLVRMITLGTLPPGSVSLSRPLQ
ncbi:MAG TPA: hypothetical protein DCE44_09875 [Verrucomicrobiales bacterium]|nr:hypothetical protein [Verrucomicrobiales bacterium]